MIRIEAPGDGDFIRKIRPFKRGLSTTYIAMGFNKKNVILDFKTLEERKIAHDLIAQADVFIENFRPGVADRIGVGYSELSKLNPRLVYASGSGFGAKGPMAHIGATDPHIQAFTASCSVNGELNADRQLWRWYGHFDCTTAMCILEGVLAALLDRETTGRGKYVVVTMIEAAMALQRVRLAEHLSGTKIAPMGSATTYLVPDQAFATLDRPLAVTASSPREWRSFCQAIDHPDLTDDPRFRRNPDRIKNRDVLIPILEGIFKLATASYWLDRLQRANVPVALFTSFDEYRDNRNYLENGSPVTFDTTDWGTFVVAGMAWTFERTPGELTPGTLPGAYTDKVRRDGWAAIAKAETTSNGRDAA